MRKVLVVRAEDQRHDFRPPCHSGFLPHNIAEFIDHERLRNGAGFGREEPRELVETVRNSYVFHNVALVKDIGPSGGDVHVDQVRRSRGWARGVGHAFQEGADFRTGEGEVAAAINIGDFGLRFSWG